MQIFHEMKYGVEALWGSDHTDTNGEVVEELIEERSLACVNDGRGTRGVDSVSCLDLTLVSGNMSNVCEWNVKNDTNLGSDHLPILYSMNFYMYVLGMSVFVNFAFDRPIPVNQ